MWEVTEYEWCYKTYYIDKDGREHINSLECVPDGKTIELIFCTDPNAGGDNPENPPGSGNNKPDSTGLPYTEPCVSFGSMMQADINYLTSLMDDYMKDCLLREMFKLSDSCIKVLQDTTMNSSYGRYGWRNREVILADIYSRISPFTYLHELFHSRQDEFFRNNNIDRTGFRGRGMPGNPNIEFETYLWVYLYMIRNGMEFKSYRKVFEDREVAEQFEEDIKKIAPYYQITNIPDEALDDLYNRYIGKFTDYIYRDIPDSHSLISDDPNMRLRMMKELFKKGC